jgi:hypothetical protein
MQPGQNAHKMLNADLRLRLGGSRVRVQRVVVHRDHAEEMGRSTRDSAARPVPSPTPPL